MTKFEIGDEIKRSDSSKNLIVSEIGLCKKRCSFMYGEGRCFGEKVHLMHKNGLPYHGSCGGYCTLVKRANQINPKKEKVIMNIPKFVSDVFKRTDDALLVAKWFDLKDIDPISILMVKVHQDEILAEARAKEAEAKAKEDK